MTEKSLESKARRAANKAGFVATKSHGFRPSSYVIRHPSVFFNSSLFGSFTSSNDDKLIFDPSIHFPAANCSARINFKAFRLYGTVTPTRFVRRKAHSSTDQESAGRMLPAQDFSRGSRRIRA